MAKIKKEHPILSNIYIYIIHMQKTLLLRYMMARTEEEEKLILGGKENV